jgi:hypothetical protein
LVLLRFPVRGKGVHELMREVHLLLGPALSDAGEIEPLPERVHSEGRRARAAPPGEVVVAFLASIYFLALHTPLLACHIPPAFSQSDFVVNFEKSLVVPDGLAEGELGDPLDPPDVPDVEPLPDPVPLFVPDGLLEPEVPEPLPLPPVWAAAIAGARAMTATKSIRISLCMISLLVSTARASRSSSSYGNIRALGLTKHRRPSLRGAAA